MSECILILVLAGVVAINLPFGYWRAGVRRFSPAWFAAVHLPVPLVAGLRIVSGLRWYPAILLLLLAACLAGQYFGGQLRNLKLGAKTTPK